MRPTYEQEVKALEEHLKGLSKEKLEELVYLVDENADDRMCIGGVNFFKVDIIRIVEALETNTEL